MNIFDKLTKNQTLKKKIWGRQGEGGGEEGSEHM